MRRCGLVDSSRTVRVPGQALGRSVRIGIALRYDFGLLRTIHPMSAYLGISSALHPKADIIQGWGFVRL